MSDHGSFFKDGYHKCHKNAYSLIGAAKALLDKGYYQHALGLANIALEEASKGVYLVLVAKNILQKQDIVPVFRIHHTKSVLLTLFNKRMKVVRNDGRQILVLDGKKITAKVLESLKKDELANMHEQVKQSSFYIGLHDTKWTSPDDLKSEDIKRMLTLCEERVKVITSMCMYMLYEPKFDQLNEFSFAGYTERQGGFNIYYETK